MPLLLPSSLPSSPPPLPFSPPLLPPLPSSPPLLLPIQVIRDLKTVTINEEDEVLTEGVATSVQPVVSPLPPVADKDLVDGANERYSSYPVVQYSCREFPRVI